MSGAHEDGWVTDLGAYRALPPLLDFAACVDPAQYRPLSPDWVVIITDVRGSTAAIEAGRYREVNQVGAMGIAALKNELGSLDYPFVFGGDGATFALPPAEAREALPVLCGVKRIAAEQFGLDLRVGCLPLDAVAGPGVGPGLSVARYAITPGLCSTLFAGGAELGPPAVCVGAAHPSAIRRSLGWSAARRRASGSSMRGARSRRASRI
ncbi:MAG: hypothetical protein RL071_1007, partial [Pseudomonadota bacterium]